MCALVVSAQQQKAAPGRAQRRILVLLSKAMLCPFAARARRRDTLTLQIHAYRSDQSPWRSMHAIGCICVIELELPRTLSAKNRPLKNVSLEQHLPFIDAIAKASDATCCGGRKQHANTEAVSEVAPRNETNHSTALPNSGIACAR